jgi:DNA-binding CsgD family transcriptional regulator
MELLERSGQLGDLDEQLARVRSSRAGRLVLIAGEAGGGKTALVRAFCERHSGVPVLAGACEALLTPRPLGPLLDIAAETGGELERLMAGTPAPADLLSALAHAVRGPRIIVLEDLHWADEATLDLVRLLGRRANRMPALVLATYRDNELEREHPLRVVLGELPVDQVRRVSVEPLSEPAVAELAGPLGIDAPALHAHTSGNPFFVTEILAAERPGETPATVRDAVLARAARLPPEARRVLEAVAIAPPRAEIWLLEQLAGADLQALDAGIASGILRPDGSAIAFRHEIARVTVERELPPHRRVDLHRRALDALAGRAEPARLAHHAEAAGDVAALVEHATAAGERAAQLRAHRQAAAHFEVALRHGVDLPPAERARLLDLRGYECFLGGMIPAAMEARLLAREAFRAAGDRLKEGETEAWIARLAWFQADTAHVAALDRAIEILGRLPPGPELARCYVQRASAHMLDLDLAGTQDWGGRALALAESLGERAIANYALISVGSAELAHGLAIGANKLARALAVARELGVQEQAGVAYSNLGSFPVLTHDYDTAERYLDEGIGYCDDHELASFGNYVAGWKARVEFDRGRWEEAGRRAHSILARLGDTLPQSRFTPLLVSGLLRARRGEGDAWEPLDEALAIAARTQECQRMIPVALARAEARWLAGEADRIEAETDDALARALVVGHRWAVGELLLWRSRGGVAVTVEHDLPAPVAAELRGDAPAAAAAWTELGCPYEAALALAAGDEGSLRSGHAQLLSLGAAAAAAVVARRLREGGARDIRRGPRQTTRTNPAGLTTRQMEVLALLARGERNADIAAHLFLSEKTVHHHVAAILRKLDVKTRGQAAAQAARLGIGPAEERSET